MVYTKIKKTKPKPISKPKAKLQDPNPQAKPQFSECLVVKMLAISGDEQLPWP